MTPAYLIIHGWSLVDGSWHKGAYSVTLERALQLQRNLMRLGG